MFGLNLGARPHPLRLAIKALINLANDTATAADGTRELVNTGSTANNPKLFLGRGLDAAVEPVAIRTSVEVLKDVARTFLATVEVPNSGGTYRWIAGKKWGAFFGVNATNVTFRLGGGQEICAHNAAPGDTITFMATRWNNGVDYVTYCKVSTGSSALITGTNHNSQALGDFAIGCRLNTDDTIDTNAFNATIIETALICETWNDQTFEAYLQQPEKLWWWDGTQHQSAFIGEAARNDMAAGHGFIYLFNDIRQDGANYYAWDLVKGSDYRQESAKLIEGMTQAATRDNAIALPYGGQPLPALNVQASSSLYARLQYAVSGYDFRDTEGVLELFQGYPFLTVPYTLPADRGFQGYTYSGSTYYVDSVNGSDTTGDGSEGNPYQTFSMSYNADNSNNQIGGGAVTLGVGDTLVLKGDFVQDLIISNTVGLHIIGTDAVLRGKLLMQAVNGVSSDNTIEGLEVTYSGSPYENMTGSNVTKMVSLVKSSNCMIDGVNVSWRQDRSTLTRTEWEHIGVTKITTAIEVKSDCDHVTVQNSQVRQSGLGIAMSGASGVVRWNDVRFVTDDFYRLRGDHCSVYANTGYQSIKVSDTHGDFCQITHPDLVGNILEPHVVNNKFVNYSDPNRDTTKHTSLTNLVGNVQGVLSTDCTPIDPVVDGNLIAITSPNGIAVQNCSPQYNTIIQLETSLTNPTYADSRWPEYCSGDNCSPVKTFEPTVILIKDSDLTGKPVVGNVAPQIKFNNSIADINNNTVELIQINQTSGANVTYSDNVKADGEPSVINIF